MVEDVATCAMTVRGHRRRVLEEDDADIDVGSSREEGSLASI